MENKGISSLLASVLTAAAAGGMAWGIRGQYGHETGAMIAGVLVGFVIVLFYARDFSSLNAAKVVAFMALGISIGGSMTYGHTVGLTHDPPVRGNWEALRWGMLGLGIKGGIWISFAGVFLGMALSGMRYRPMELALALFSMLFLFFLGVYLFNQPFSPENRQLPTIYFSKTWDFFPHEKIEPRFERWGGLLMALVGLVLFARIAKRDRLALRLALWGFIAGGIGFPAGQSIQAFAAWNVEFIQTGWIAEYLPKQVNWWNMMETTFGAVFGAILAVGVWINQSLIVPSSHEPSDDQLNLPTELLLVLIHTISVIAWNFTHYPMLGRFSDMAITMIFIPVLAVTAGRFWPYFMSLPMVLIPIAGKTVRELVFNKELISPVLGVFVYIVIPMTLAISIFTYLARRAADETSQRFVGIGLPLAVWSFFFLNHAFFQYAWPWKPWTNRTPNDMIFFGCALWITIVVVVVCCSSKKQVAPLSDARADKS